MSTQGKIEKIEIEGEGKQVYQLLMNKNHITKKKSIVKRYANKLGLYEVTLKNYLQRKIINNSKFQTTLEEEFRRPYEELVRTVKNQIISYIESMRDSIHLYDKEVDLLNTDELVQLCQQYQMHCYRLMVKGNRARIKINMGLRSEAKPLLEEIIQEAKELGYLDLYIYYTTTMTYIYHEEKDYPTFRKRLRELEDLGKYEKTVENKWALYQYWHTYGTLMMKMKMYSTATAKFKLALGFAEVLYDQINALDHVALTYKLDGRYQLAMEWYEKALKTCGKGNFGLKAILQKNMALLHYETGNKEKAKQDVNVAMQHVSHKIDIMEKVNILEAYLLIMEDYEGVLKEVINILLEKDETIENFESLFKFIDALIEKLMKGNEINLLMRLRDQFKLMIRFERDEEKVLQLKVRFADIMVYLMGVGGG